MLSIFRKSKLPLNRNRASRDSLFSEGLTNFNRLPFNIKKEPKFANFKKRLKFHVLT